MSQNQQFNPFYLINNITIKTKFIILGLVVAVPLVLFMWMNISRLNNEIAFSSAEQKGVAFIAPIRQLIQNSQAHRGMSNAFLSGKYSLKDKIDAAEQRADDAMAAIEKINQQYGATFKTQERWQWIKSEWKSIKQEWAKAKASPYSVPAKDNFNQHTVFINYLLDYILYISDKSGLTIDPQVSTYYLIDIVYFKTLHVIENMGKIRGLGAGVAARKTATPLEIRKLAVMSTDVENLLKGFKHDMTVLKSAGHDTVIKEPMSHLQSSIANLNTMVKKELLNTESITIDSAHYFAEASKSIKLSYDTFDHLTGLLATMLSDREQEEQSLLNKIYLLALASLLIVAFLLITIAKNVIEKSSQLKDRMAGLAEGAFLEAGNKEIHAKDELGQAMHSADTLESTLKNMLLSMSYVSKQQAAGDIDSDIQVNMFKGAYAEMAHGVNEMVAGHIEMNKKILACVKKFGEGDLNAPLEQFPGKKAMANQAIEQVRRNINALIEDTMMLSDAARHGKLSTRAETKRHYGDFRKVVEGINDTLDAFTHPLNTAAHYVASIAKGEIPEKIEETYHGDFDSLKQNLNQCIDAINALVSDANTLASAAAEGNLSSRADANRHLGDFRKIVTGVNKTLDSVVGPLNAAAECVANIAKGDIPEQITATYAGDFNIIKSNLNICISAINRLVSDANMLANAAAEGRVETRADTSLHEGDFRKVVEGVNATLETIVKPIQAVKEATETINGVASEISTGNNDLSARTERQASSLEKTASSMGQLAATVKQNADNAKHANNLAREASKVVTRGSQVVDEVVTTMADINDSAAKIEEIISVIDGIAFQTNILALNAAVEAARAGEQGRGFAVVAGEVRNLAQRSSGAAKEIKELITDSVTKTTEGTVQVESAGKTMREILNSVNQVSGIINEISSASEEQSNDISQVNIAIGNMDETTQQNAALVEEAAAAAESLLDQTNALTQTINVFKIGAQADDSLEVDIADGTNITPIAMYR